MISAIDLFCGAGGLTSGLQAAGVSVACGIDFDASCSHAFEHNNGGKFLHRNVKDISGDDLKPFFKKGSMTLLAGCAPCQPFSKYTQGRDGSKDPKWGLLGEFARLIGEIKPDFVTMENVSTLTRHAIFEDFQTHLRDLGYVTKAGVIRCVNFGLPQTRQRLVLIASKRAIIEFPVAECSTKTVRDAIGDLPTIGHGECDPLDRLHRASRLSVTNLKRIRASKPGGTWRDWPESLRADCHTRESGQSYPSVYGRMEWDKPSPTITTQCHGFGNGRFGHPEQDRAISLREAAILQSFPRDYEFIPNDSTVHFCQIGRHIGNAVPPLIGELVGRALLEATL